jgi:transposase
VRFAGKTVEIFHKGQRVASHGRADPARPHDDRGAHPSSHRRHAAWTPARLVAYAETIGPSTAALFEAIMAHRPPPEQGFRTDLDILALTRSYDKARMDAACRRGVSIKVRSVAPIRSILKIGLDRAFSTEAERFGRRAPAPRKHPWPRPLPQSRCGRAAAAQDDEVVGVRPRGRVGAHGPSRGLERGLSARKRR